jgi:hypothetical protein
VDRQIEAPALLAIRQHDKALGGGTGGELKEWASAKLPAMARARLFTDRTHQIGLLTL